MPITCPKYEARSDSKKCRYFYDEWEDLAGACERDDEFMCVEWLKKFPGSWEDHEGRVHPVDRDGLVHLTSRPKL